MARAVSIVWVMLAAVLCLSGVSCSNLQRCLYSDPTGDYRTYAELGVAFCKDASGIVICPYGTYKTFVNVCEYDPSGCTTTFDWYSCRMCQGGKYNPSLTHQNPACLNCGTIIYQGETRYEYNSMVTDYENQAWPISTNQCIGCSTGSRANGWEHRNPIPDPAHEHDTDIFTRCVCIPGYGANNPQQISITTNGAHCIECPSGTVQEQYENRACHQCNPVSSPNLERTKCLCASGYIPDYNIERPVCSACNAREVAERGELICTECLPGQVRNAARSACIDCAENKYQLADECVTCPGFFSSPVGSAACDTDRCIDGYRFDNVLGCRQCPAGTRLNRHDDAEISSPDVDECRTCIANTFSSAGSMQCTQCAMHQTAPEGAGACTPCPYTRNDAGVLVGSYLFEAELLAGEQVCRDCNAESTICATDGCCPIGQEFHALMYQTTNSIFSLELTSGLEVSKLWVPLLHSCEESDSNCQILHQFEWNRDAGLWVEQFRLALQSCKDHCMQSDTCHLMQYQKEDTSDIAKCIAWDRSLHKDVVSTRTFPTKAVENYPDGVTFEEVNVWIKDIQCCSQCEDGKYSQFVDMQPCAACPAGQIHLKEESVWNYVTPNCHSCEAGKYATADMTTCELCAAGEISDVGAGGCTQCPRGKYMGTQDDWQARNTDTDDAAARTVEQCTEICGPCDEQQYRSGCTAFSAGECTACKTCPAGFARIGCVHYSSTTFYEDEEAGRCIDSSVLVRTPQCPQEVSGVAEPVSPDLSGFTFEQVFGQTQTSLLDFQCRRSCIGQTQDTTYCTGPHACNRPACTMARTEDGSPDYLVARGCPVLLPDVELTGRAVTDLTDDEQDELLARRQTGCQTCATCGSSPPADAVDWGLGCAAECSQLLCDAGEIFDFTAPPGAQCRSCAQLTDLRLCSTQDQARLDVNTDGVSGLGQLLQWASCREKPQPASGTKEPATYGRCTACAVPECPASEFPRTCGSAGCAACRLRNNREMFQGLYVNASYDAHTLFCQLPPCEAASDGARTGVVNSGDVCVRVCEPPGECAADMHELPCRLPHDTRCVAVEPTRPASAVRRGVVPAHANVLELVPPDPSDAPALYASFENVLVNLREDEWNQHQCVWDALGILDNDVLPGGISAAMLSTSDAVDALGLVGSKHCRPIGTAVEDAPAWDRDPRRALRLVPLQNTVLEAGEHERTEHTPRRALLNGTASVMAYNSGLFFATHKTTLPSAPPGVQAGDLLLALNLQQAANVSVLLPVPTERASPLWLTAHGSWELSAVLQEIAEPVALRSLHWELGLATHGQMRRTGALPGLAHMTLGVLVNGEPYTSRAAAAQSSVVTLPPAILRLYGARVGVAASAPGCHSIASIDAATLGSSMGPNDAASDTVVLGRLGLRTSGALLDDDLLLRATLAAETDLRLPVVAYRMGPVGYGMLVLATPTTVEVRATATGALWTLPPEPRAQASVARAFLVVDVAIAETMHEGHIRVLALVQEESGAQGSTLMHTVCAEADTTCVWRGVQGTVGHELAAVDMARVLVDTGTARTARTVVHAIAVQTVLSELSEGSAERSHILKITWLQWLLAPNGDDAVLEAPQESILALPASASLEFVGAHSVSVAAAPAHPTQAADGTVSAEAGMLRSLAAVPLTRTAEGTLAGSERAYDVALHVRLGSSELNSHGSTFLLAEEADTAGDADTAARVRALFSNEPRADARVAAVQCRAGLSWVASHTFVVAWPCAGLVFRCEVSADGARFAFTALHSRSALATQAFAHTPLPHTGPVDNTLLVLVAPRSRTATVPAVAACLHGFVLSDVPFENLQRVQAHPTTCALWCMARTDCHAYSISNGKCSVREAALPTAFTPDAPPRVCAKVAGARSTLLPRSLLQAVGLANTAPAGVQLVSEVQRAVHLREFVPLQPGERALVAGVVCAPPNATEPVELVEGNVDTVPLPAEVRAAAQAADALLVPADAVLLDDPVPTVAATLGFPSTALALLVQDISGLSLQVASGDVTLYSCEHTAPCRAALFSAGAGEDVVMYVGKTLQTFTEYTVSLGPSTGQQLTLHLGAGSRLVRAYLHEGPIRSLAELWAQAFETGGTAPVDTASGDVPIGEWARARVHLPAPLPAHSFVALTVRRQANFVNDFLTSDEFARCDAAEWPTRSSTVNTRIVGVDAFQLLPVLSRAHSGADPPWRVYVPTEDELAALDLQAAWYDGASGDSWPRVYARVALQHPGGEEQQWTARLRHLQSDAYTGAYTGAYPAEQQGALAQLGCDFAAAQLGVQQCYVALPLTHDGASQVLGLEITCVNPSGGGCAGAGELPPGAVTVTIPPFMALNECGKSELLSHGGECVPCAEAEDETEEDCPLGERRAVCVELRPPGHRHDESCETCPDVTGWQYGTHEWTPPSSVFQGNWKIFHTDDLLGNDLEQIQLTHLGAPSDENVAIAAASCAVFCNHNDDPLNKCLWFFLHFGTSFTKCLYPKSSATYQDAAVITPPTDRSLSQTVGSWVFAPDNTNKNFYLYYMTPAPPCTWQCQDGYYRDGDECLQCTEAVPCVPGFRTRTCGGEHDSGCTACELPFGAEYDEHGALYNIEWQQGSAECAFACKQGFYEDTQNMNICQECTNLAGLHLQLLDAAPGTFYRFDACGDTHDAVSRLCENEDDKVVYTAHAAAFGEDCAGHCVRAEDAGLPADGHDYRAVTDAATDVAGQNLVCAACPAFKDVENKWPFSPTREARSGCEPICPAGWQRATIFPATESDNFLTDYPVACRQVDETLCAPNEFLDAVGCLSASLALVSAVRCHNNFCRPCQQPGLVANQQYTRVGDASCVPQCVADYFWHAGAKACLKHADHGEQCAPPNFYWAEGNADFDAVCLPCTSCDGQFEQQACGDTSDTVCTTCTPLKAANAHWLNTKCEQSECDAGFVRDLRSTESLHMQPCVQCAHVCPAGQHFHSPRRHCTDCVDCPSKPSNAWWTGPPGTCGWSCPGDAVVRDAATGERLCQQSRAASVYEESVAASAPLPTRLLCGAREYLNTSYQCESCVGRVPTPPAADEDQTWFWVANAVACQWECLRGFVLFVDRVGARHCLTWEQYQSTALLGLTTARVDRQFAQRFARIETRQERLAALDLVQLAVVLLTCGVLVARGGARAEAVEGAGGKV